METRSKAQPLDRFADRPRGHRWGPTQVRVFLARLGEVLLEASRRLGLAGTALAQVQVGTLRLKRLQIGAVSLRTTRRGRLLLSSAYPDQARCRQGVARVASGELAPSAAPGPVIPTGGRGECA